MAKIQIADLHSENFVKLTAEEQYLIQGGIWGAVALYIIDHWSDIKKGVSDPWKGK